MQSVISNVIASDCLRDPAAIPSQDNQYSPGLLSSSMRIKFEEAGWQTRESLKVSGIRSRTSVIDVVKNSIGVEYTFAKFTYTESVIFVKFSLFINANKFKIGLVVTPAKPFMKLMPVGVGSFEMVRDRIKAITPLPIKYPFAIIGISDQPSRLEVEEFTSPLDQYLLDILGHSLLEIQLQSEKQSYDFKETLPPDNDKVAKELCAFANLQGGGLLIVGVEDNGNVSGILREDLDKVQLRVANIAATKCSPLPEIECRAFNIPGNPARCLLTIYIHEIARKPCMTKERVYVRVGAEARPAKPDEIRKMILGTAE